MHDVAVRRILVGYDGSDGGRRALDRAIAEARESRGRIVVLSVANMPLSPDAPRHFGTLDDISGREGAQLSPPPDVVDHLTEARDVLAAAGHDAELTWTAGEPGRAIVETATRIRAGVIVLGEHHHGFLSNLFGADVGAEVQRGGLRRDPRLTARGFRWRRPRPMVDRKMVTVDGRRHVPRGGRGSAECRHIGATEDAARVRDACTIT